MRRVSIKEWWGWISNPFVKGVTGCVLSLFLALNFPVIFLAIVAAALSYAVVPVAVAYAYRNRYAIVGKSELVFRFVRRSFSGFREGCRLTVAHTLEGYERRKLLKQEKLRRYKRERNRRKREQARRALA